MINNRTLYGVRGLKKTNNMIKIFVLILNLIFMSSTCLAMTFQTPIELGKVASLTPNGEFKFTNATSIQGSSAKGTACFGEGSTAIYVHYDNSYVNSEDFKLNAFHSKELINSCKVGAQELNNTLILPLGFPHDFSIYLIKTDEKIQFYLFEYNASAVPTYVVIGKRADGLWIKYFETVAAEQYYGMTRAYCHSYHVDGDKIIFEYGRYNATEKKFATNIELHFCWEDDTQWFGVEQITY